MSAHNTAQNSYCNPMKSICLLLTSLFLLPSFSIAAFGQQGRNAVTVSALRCEYLTDPMAVDTREPRLSWVIEGTARGAKQTAYQVVVASSANDLAANKGSLWDTGKVVSNQTIQITYQGKPLASRQ